MKLLGTLFSILLSFSVHAKVDQCSTEMERLIKLAYNNNTIEITKLLGPYSYSQAYFDQNGNPGLKFFRTYTVIYWDKVANPNGSALITAQCEADSEPVSLIDTNKDGRVDLNDMVTVQSPSH